MKLVDLHADIGYDVWQKRKANETNILKKYHLKKWQEGGIDTICMASFFEGHETWEEMQQMILTLKEEIALCDELQLVLCEEDLKSPKIKAVLSVEGMCGIKENEVACIEWLYQQGVRLASLTWNEENYLATGAKGDSTRGLSDAGLRAVHAMEHRHMIIDVSHANEKTFWDIMKHTTGMVIATHSNSKTLCNHVRNISDEQAIAIARRGGVIGAVAAPWFVNEVKEKQDVMHLTLHQQYFKEIVGIDHLAFGFDFMDFFEGYDTSYVEGLKDASQAQEMVRHLEENGINNSDLEKIAYKNAISILKTSLKCQ